MKLSGSQLLCEVDVNRFDAYSGTTLSNLSLEARPGDCVWISGPTGSGKSTILHLLALHAERSTTPVVHIGPRAVIEKPLRALEMRSLPDLAYVSQETVENLVAPSAAEDIETSLMNEGSDNSSHAQSVVAVLSEGGDALKRNWRTLSSGWRQLVSILSAGALRRKVYIFDEPLANLDSTNAARVISVFRILRERGACIIFASHDVRMLADEISVTCTGWVLERLDRSIALSNLVGKIGELLEPLRPSDLEARDLTVSLKGFTVLDRCELLVRSGEFVAIMGANGSGKTTLARALAGLQKPTAGSVQVGGRVLKRAGDFVGYSPQSSRHALLGRTLGEELQLVLPREIQSRIFERLGQFVDLRLDALSFGERKLLSIAVAVLSRPLCILDEPLAGLDHTVAQQVLSLLTTACERGRGIVSFVPQGQIGIAGATRLAHLRNGNLSDGAVS